MPDRDQVGWRFSPVVNAVDAAVAVGFAPRRFIRMPANSVAALHGVRMADGALQRWTTAK